MGVLSDTIVAPLCDAGQLLEADPRNPRWPRWDLGGLGQVDLGQLEAVLFHRPYDESIVERMSLVADGGEDGPWVYSIPDLLASRLAELADDQIPEVGRTWAKAEEFALAGWRSEDVVAALRDLVEASRVSRRLQQPLLMWMSL